MTSKTTGSTDRALKSEADDALEIKHYAGGLANFIATCETPMTIGVQGEWGSGKTSLMQLVLNRLKASSEDTDSKHPRFVVHWFDTWQYGAVGNADVLGMRLMEDLTRQIEQAEGEKDLRVVRAAQNMWRVARQVAPGVANTKDNALAHSELGCVKRGKK